jgi:hypothetical protein
MIKKRAISQLADTLIVLAANENNMSIIIKVRMIEPITVISFVLDIKND